MRTNIRHLLTAAVVVAIFALVPAAASAASNIEGVWSFNGGKVAIQATGDGSYVGTVVEPTKFDTCFHRVGEQMWTGIQEQSDGSYWGLHHWFYDDVDCTPNPTLGKTAWRVIEQGTSRFLRVCFSEPGSASQPTIAADGTTAGATFGCSDSALVSALPGAENATDYLKLPQAGGCIAHRRLRLRLVEPIGDPFATVSAMLTSKGLKRRGKLSRLEGAVRATFSLHGLAELSFRVKVVATTVLGHTLTAKRSYKRCTVPKHLGHR